MMRLRLASLVLLAGCLAALLGAAGASSASSPKTPPSRTLALSLSPVPGDLELAQISFSVTREAQRISSGDLRLAASGPLGDDYLVLATPSSRPSRSPKALVLLVNRASALLDPAEVRLRLRTPSALGKPRVWRLIDPFTHSHVGVTPALCDLNLHGAPALGGLMLHVLSSRGTAISGFNSATAVAEAYDATCGLPFQSAFELAIRPPDAPSPTPSPTPPAPSPPGCTPCNPVPGYACPLVVPSVCRASPADLRRPAGASAH